MTNAKLAVADLHKFMPGFDRMLHDTSVFAPLSMVVSSIQYSTCGRAWLSSRIGCAAGIKMILRLAYKGLLTVSGNVKQVESSNEKYVYKGLRSVFHEHSG